jgi:hypothetical protein
MQKYAPHYLACVAQLGAQVRQWTYLVTVQQSDLFSFRLGMPNTVSLVHLDCVSASVLIV